MVSEICQFAQINLLSLLFGGVTKDCKCQDTPKVARRVDQIARARLTALEGTVKQWRMWRMMYFFVKKKHV